MSEKLLTHGKENFLHALYEHEIVMERTPCMFREKYDDGCVQRRWSVDEIVELNGDLVEFNSDLIQAGNMCPSLTNAEKRYVGVFQAT